MGVGKPKGVSGMRRMRTPSSANAALFISIKGSYPTKIIREERMIAERVKRAKLLI
jgi:hypothetical protein